MSDDPSRFWRLLFRKGEQTCFAENQYGAGRRAVFDPAGTSAFEFFSINPLGSLVNDNGNYRHDANVVAYRNILIEFDKMTIADQAAFVKRIKLPWNTAVYSGGKSVHLIISLAEDLPNAAAYSALVRRVYAACPGVDRNNSNPSRLSRCPGTLRVSKGKYQRLLDVGPPVSYKFLDDWLLARGIGELPEYVPPPRRQSDPSDPQWFTDLLLSPWTKRFLADGAEKGDRHQAVKLAAYDFARAGKTIEEAQERLLAASGLDCEGRTAEVIRTISYCYARCQ